MRLNEINVADNAATWTAMGFSVVDDYVQIGHSLRFKLSGGTGGDDGSGNTSGVVDYTFGDAGRAGPETFDINGLTTKITGLPDWLNQPPTPHANSVVGSMKTVILANDADETSKQLRVHMPELGDPVVSDTSDTGIRYDYWTGLDDTDFEVISKQEAVARDTIAVVFLFVDDLETAIDTFGTNNVSDKSVYANRTTVEVMPDCGISVALRLITHDLIEPT